MDDEDLGRVHAPIGLPIGSRTPEEVAVAIAAEIISVSNEKTPRLGQGGGLGARRSGDVKVENSFEVPASAAGVGPPHGSPRIVPCMPGAELRETVGGDRWKADMAVKLGRSLNFDTDVTRAAVDEAGSSVTLNAEAREKRGRGGAQAAIQSSLTEVDPQTTHVDIVTDLTLSGAVAQYGRGIVQGRLSRWWAGSPTASSLSWPPRRRSRPRRPSPSIRPKPVKGLDEGLGAAWRSFLRVLASAAARRLPGRGARDRHLLDRQRHTEGG